MSCLLIVCLFNVLSIDCLSIWCPVYWLSVYWLSCLLIPCLLIVLSIDCLSTSCLSINRLSIRWLSGLCQCAVESVIKREITLMDIKVHYHCLLSSSQDPSKCLFVLYTCTHISPRWPTWSGSTTDCRTSLRSPPSRSSLPRPPSLSRSWWARSCWGTSWWASRSCGGCRGCRRAGGSGWQSSSWSWPSPSQPPGRPPTGPETQSSGHFARKRKIF